MQATKPEFATFPGLLEPVDGFWRHEWLPKSPPPPRVHRLCVALLLDEHSDRGSIKECLISLGRHFAHWIVAAQPCVSQELVEWTVSELISGDFLDTTGSVFVRSRTNEFDDAYLLKLAECARDDLKVEGMLLVLGTQTLRRDFQPSFALQTASRGWTLVFGPSRYGGHNAMLGFVKFQVGKIACVPLPYFIKAGLSAIFHKRK